MPIIPPTANTIGAGVPHIAPSVSNGAQSAWPMLTQSECGDLVASITHETAATLAAIERYKRPVP